MQIFDKVGNLAWRGVKRREKAQIVEFAGSAYVAPSICGSLKAKFATLSLK